MSTINISCEEWRPCLGGAYEVSSIGRVRTAAGAFLNVRSMRTGYRVVAATAPGSKSRPHLVHALVAEAWHGPRPAGYECNHIDGVKANNRPENLEWVTPIENKRHAVRLGLHGHGCLHGSEHGSSRLHETDIVRIRELHAEGRKHQEIADAFGISIHSVHKIAGRGSWRHVP